MKKSWKHGSFIGVLMITTLLVTATVFAEGFPTHAKLKEALKTVVAEQNGRFGLQMWATIVDRDGVVQTVVFSGEQ